MAPALTPKEGETEASRLLALRIAPFRRSWRQLCSCSLSLDATICTFPRDVGSISADNVLHEPPTASPLPLKVGAQLLTAEITREALRLVECLAGDSYRANHPEYLAA